MKLFTSAFTYNDIPYDVEHYNVAGSDSFPADLDFSLVEKVHAICELDGKIVLTSHPKWNIWGLPGGSVEEGESPIETLKREVEEETSCRVETLTPLSYQKVISQVDGSTTIRLHYFCTVSKISEFESDVAGSVEKIIWIDPKDYEQYIEDKGFRRVVFEE